MNEYILTKSYDGKIVKIPADKKEGYIKKQNLIKKYINNGKNKRDVLNLLKSKNDD